jgi:hypothetical protein
MTSRHPATTPILAARAIVQGDVSTARALLAGHKWGSAFRVCEARAIIGACREAGRRYGCSIDPRSILGW